MNSIKSKKTALVLTLLAYYSFIFYNMWLKLEFHLNLGLPMAGLSKDFDNAYKTFDFKFLGLFFLINFIGLILVSNSQKRIHDLLIPLLSLPFLLKGYLDNVNLFNPNSSFDIKLFTPLNESQKIIFFNQPGFDLQPFHDLWAFKLQTVMLSSLVVLLISYIFAIIINTKIKSKKKFIFLCSVLAFLGIIHFDIISYMFYFTFIFLLINSWENENGPLALNSAKS